MRRRASRASGSSEVATRMCSGSPASSVRSSLDGGRDLGGVRALELDRVEVPPGGRRRRSRRPARPSVVGDPGRGEGADRARGQLGNLVAVAEQDRRADRRGHQRGRRDAGGPVVAVDQRHRARPRDAAGGRVRRERDAGGVGDRVGPGDPGRVLGREGREAEVLGLLRQPPPRARSPPGRRGLDRGAGLLVVLGRRPGRRSRRRRRAAPPTSTSSSLWVRSQWPRS